MSTSGAVNIRSRLPRSSIGARSSPARGTLHWRMPVIAFTACTSRVVATNSDPPPTTGGQTLSMWLYQRTAPVARSTAAIEAVPGRRTASPSTIVETSSSGTYAWWSSSAPPAAGGAASVVDQTSSTGRSGATYGSGFAGFRFGCCPETSATESATKMAISSRRTTICCPIIGAPTQSLGCVASNDPRARVRLAVYAAHREAPARAVGVLRNRALQRADRQAPRAASGGHHSLRRAEQRLGRRRSVVWPGDLHARNAGGRNLV